MTPAGPPTSFSRPGPPRRAEAALIILLFLAASCTRQSSAVSKASDLQILLEAESQAVGRTALTIRIVDASGQAVSGAQVTIRGDMSHAGMSPILAQARETGTGVYETDFKWTMAGDWIVTVGVDRPGHEPVKQDFDLTVTGHGG